MTFSNRRRQISPAPLTLGSISSHLCTAKYANQKASHLELSKKHSKKSRALFITMKLFSTQFLGPLLGLFLLSPSSNASPIDAVQLNPETSLITRQNNYRGVCREQHEASSTQSARSLSSTSTFIPPPSTRSALLLHSAKTIC